MAQFEIKDGVAIIPEGAAEIVEDTFYDCSSLESVIIPESVTSIGWYACSGCTSLKNITLPGVVSGYVKVKYTCLAYLKWGLYCLTLPFRFIKILVQNLKKL